MQADFWGRTKPPKGVAVNHLHPEASALTRSLLFNEKAGQPRELLTGKRAALENTVTWSPSMQQPWSGSNLRIGASDGRLNLGDSSLFLPTGEITIILGYRKTDTSARASGAFGVANTVLGERCGVHLPYSDGTVYWDYGGATDGTSRAQIAGLSFGQSDVWAFTAGPRGHEIWRNGKLLKSNGAGTSTTRTSSTTDFKLGTHGGEAADFADYHFLHVYAKQISVKRIETLAYHPFAMMAAPVFRRFFVPAAANVNVTLAALTAAWSAPVPTLSAAAQVILPSVSASWSAPTPVASSAQNISLPVPTATWSAPTPSSTADAAVALPATSAAWSAPTGSLVSGNTVDLSAVAASWSNLSPSVTVSAVVVLGALTATWSGPVLASGVTSQLLPVLVATWSAPALGVIVPSSGPVCLTATATLQATPGAVATLQAVPVAVGESC